MTISAKIIADSQSPAGVRLTTFQLRYPRMIHSEFMTHRVFSRNASSSRAVPVKRLIEDIRRDPAMPIYWGKNQPGMSAREECTAPVLLNRLNYTAKEAWLEAMESAIDFAEAFNKAGYHKQIVNRLLEPFSHINVVVTATEWDNFYALRRHEDAQPEIKVLADAMWDAQQASTPHLLALGQWHLPYVTEADYDTLNTAPDETLQTDSDISQVIKLSVARCARVSYLTHDGKAPNVSDDLKLYDRLVGSVPLHASPCEHQATPDRWDVFLFMPGGSFSRWDDPASHGNLRGWKQYRKTLPNESVTAYSG